MSDTQNASQPTRARTRHTVVVPTSIDMVSLLGPGDEHLALLGQFRDTPIRVREGDAVGYGIMESIITGEWPDLGLTAESDRDVSNA